MFLQKSLHSQFYGNNISLSEFLKTSSNDIAIENLNNFYSLLLSNYYAIKRLLNTTLNRSNITYSNLPIKQIEISKPDIFTRRFIINSSNATKVWENVDKIVKSLEHSFEAIGDYSKKQWEKNTGDTLHAVFSVFASICDMGSIVFPWLVIGSLVCNFIASFYTLDKFSYIYETEDVKYIWNGGWKETWFFGIIPGREATIEDMKLLNPMQIINPNNNEGYYYNGKLYDDVDQVKVKQLDDIINNRYDNESLKKVYSLLPLNDPTLQGIDPLYYNYSLNDLSLSFSNHVKEVIMNNNFINDPIIAPNKYKFGSFIYDKYKTLEDNVNSVLNNIKPTLIAQTPILNPANSEYANIPIFSNTDNIDDSINPYKLPGKSWTSTGGYATNLDQNFIMVDQNPIDNNKHVNYIKALEDQFIKMFDVDSKVIDNKFLNISNLYSELSSKIESNYCYITSGKNNNKKIFLDKDNAYKWLMSEFDLQTHFVNETIQTYFYNGLVFNSYLEFSNWVYNNIKEEK